jgi:cytidylate kinase
VPVHNIAGDLIIAIDGPAGAGKSSVARGLAEYLGYTYIDTGGNWLRRYNGRI